MNRFYIIMALIVVIMVTAGCNNSDDALNTSEMQSVAVIKDDLGREINFSNKPERIVVTSASFLDPLHEIGGNIVGRPDSRTNMPDWAKNIASVGQVYQIDTERLLACNPDLVIINRGMNEKLLDILNENNIPALVMDMKTYDDVKHEITIFAELIGNIDKGNEIIQQMDNRIDAIIDAIPKDSKRVAILHSTAQGLSVQLDGSIAGNIVNMLGWDNVASGMTPLENNPDAAPYSLETLAAQNPEIIFITSMGQIDEIKSNMQDAVSNNDAWQAIDAIKNDRVYYLPQNLFLLSPALNYPEAVETMAHLVYPKK